MPNVTKFHVQPSKIEGTTICSNGPGHIPNMVAMPIEPLNVSKVEGTICSNGPGHISNMVAMPV